MRLKDYDYSQAGYYFITICTFQQQNILGQIPLSVGAIHESPEMVQLPVMRKSPAGDIVEQILLEIPSRYPSVTLDKYVIMPNHLHMIIILNEETRTKERAIRESPLQSVERSLISKMVGYLKMNASKRIRLQNDNIFKVWQRSYHDHIIRSESTYQKIWQYMDENPVKWPEDCFYAE